jgi:acyl-CoA reductase-like NAD-dependent aldehyde dehydrogenase
MNDYKLLIGGEWTDSSTDETFDDLNPATLAKLASFQVASEADVDRAVEAAWDAFEIWSETPAPKRAMVLFRAARLLEERKEELAALMTQEMGKELPETRGDVQEAIDITLYAAGEGRRMLGETTTAELKDKFCMTVLQDIASAFRAIKKIEAGITYVNSSTIGAEVHLSFGGVKGTGNGFREAGTDAIKEFTEVKTVYIDYSGKLQKAPMG